MNIDKNLVVLVALHPEKFPILGESHGIAAISGYLKYKFPHIRVKTFDLQIANSEDVLQYINESKPCIVGFSVKLYTFEQVQYFYKELSGNISEYRPLIVMGNAVPTFNGEYILKHYFKDVIISSGEGEYTFEDLYKYVHGDIALSDVRNISYYENEKVVQNNKVYFDSSEIYLPDRSNTKYFFDTGNEVYVEGSRGCAYGGCTICACSDFLGSKDKSYKWRPRPVNLIIEDFEQLSDLNIGNVTFADEDFIGDGIEGNKRIIELCKNLILAKTGVSFRMNACIKSFYSRKDTPEIQEIKEQMVKLLKQAGLSKVFLGLESVVESQLKRYRKGFVLEEFFGALHLLKKYNIDCEYGIILIDPLMTFEELGLSLSVLYAKGFVDSIATLYKELRVQIKHDYIRMIRKAESISKKKILGEFDFNQQSYEVIRFLDDKIDLFVSLMRPWIDDIYRFYYVMRIYTRYAEDEESDVNHKLCFRMINRLREFEYKLMVELVSAIKAGCQQTDLRKIKEAFEVERRKEVKQFVLSICHNTKSEEIINEANKYLN